MQFLKVNSDQVRVVRSARTSKYDELVDACRTLELGEIVAVQIEAEQDPSSFRLNVANAIRSAINEPWEAAGVMRALRVSLGRSADGEKCILIECKEVSQEALEKKKASSASRSAAMKERQAKRKAEGKPVGRAAGKKNILAKKPAK